MVSSSGTQVSKVQLSKAAATAIQDACMALGYICVLSGELACFLYGGSRPPTTLEVVLLMPGVKYKDRPSIDTLKRSIAAFDPGPTAHFFISPPAASPVILSFTDLRFADQWDRVPVELSIASGFNEVDIQPMKILDGLQYASAEFVLSARLSRWFDFHVKGQKSTRDWALLQSEEIDPMLGHLVKTGSTISKWHLFGYSKILAYCNAYPTSSTLWHQIGYNSNGQFPAPTSGTASQTPAASAPRASTPVDAVSRKSSLSSPAPPPYQLSADASSDLEPPPEGTAPVAPAAAAAAVAAPTPATAATTLLDTIKNPTRIQMLMMAAHQAIHHLDSIRLPSAIFGSLACFMYGNTRSPNDVDILVLPTLDDERTIEDVKATLALHDPEHFFLLIPRDPAACYKILYYRLSSDESSPTPLVSCKVDLVFPGTLNLPRLPLSSINWDEGLPLIPFSLLLLQKLQSWDHHGKSAEKLKVLKQRTDVEDLKGMFKLNVIEKLKCGLPWADEDTFSWNFLEASALRVRQICTEYPAVVDDWKSVGFLV